MDTDTTTDTPQKSSDKIDFNTAGEIQKNKKRNQHPRKQQTLAVDDPVEALNRRARELSTQIEQEPVVDIEKVKAIKAAISAGTYQVDANRIATKLMELEFHLNKPPKDS